LVSKWLCKVHPGHKYCKVDLVDETLLGRTKTFLRYLWGSSPDPTADEHFYNTFTYYNTDYW
jgi:hypothetical protein